MLERLSPSSAYPHKYVHFPAPKARWVRPARPLSLIVARMRAATNWSYVSARSSHGTVPSLKPLIVVQHTPIREEERLSELETSRGTLLAIIGCFQGCSLDLSLVHTPDDLPEEDLTT